ncbi:MAG: hypothetical protein J5I93_11245 [Pirellulaceae bacterium]|nr:hypothetical protein [Pirellulaceae bacterium]
MSSFAASLKNLPAQPAYLVGVTGHMDLRHEEVEPLKERVRLVFRFLKPPSIRVAGDDWDASDVESEHQTRWRAHLDQLLELLPATSGRHEDQEPKRPYELAVECWPRLKHTPVLVLTALAPGADTLVAEVALEPEFRAAGFQVLAALPMPADLYVNSTSFVSADGTDEDNQRRQQRFRELLAEVQPENTFVVHLKQDSECPAGQLCDEERLRQRFEAAAQQDKAQRRQRYRVAGEYLASYCHLLLAIWDHHHNADNAEGTAAIVDARRRGPQPGLLPTTDSLGMPHGGPVLHLHTQRLKNSTAPPAATPPARFLQACNVPRRKNAIDDDADWQQLGLTVMTRIAANLDHFNALGHINDDRAQQELFQRLMYRDQQGRSQTLAGELQAASDDLVAPLRRLAGLRRQASEANRNLSSKRDRALRWLFVFTALAACSLDFFAHWHPRADHHAPSAAVGHAAGDSGGAAAGLAEDVSGAPDHALAATPSQIPADAHEPPDAASQHGEWILLYKATGWISQPLLGGLTVLFTVTAMLWYWWERSLFRGERAHDYRAIAEGARVQFYWHLAGLGKSVSAHYMDRQRNELDWIRAAIRSASFPYETARFAFARLGPDLQVKALRCVLHSWVQDQRKYFKNSFEKHEHALHAGHKWGNTLALAGLWIILLLVCSVALHTPAGADHDHLDWLNPWGETFLLAGGAIALLGTLLAWLQSEPAIEPGRRPAARSLKDRWKHFRHRLPDLWIPAVNTYRDPHNVVRTRWQMLGSFAAYLPASLTLAAILIGLLVVFSTRTGNLPNGQNLVIVGAGCLLILGALIVAWTEKNLKSELAYQYHTMLSLFANADETLSRQIDRLAELEADWRRADEQVRQAEAASPPDPSVIAAARRAADQRLTDFREQIKVVQDAILELGGEALDENAEWLILHRARPLEPVMAG